MNCDRISARQLYVLLFVALLAPATRVLPGETAGIAGRAAWLTGLAALPVLLLMAWVFTALFRGRPAGTGLCDIFRLALGPIFGRVLTIIYMVWALLLLSRALGQYGERMLGTTPRGGALTALLLVLLALAYWLGGKKLAALARTAEIFYLILSVALGAVLCFSLLEFPPENVLPVWADDLPAVARGTVVPLGVMGPGVLALFLWGSTAPAAGDGKRGLRWLCWGCVVMSALQFGVLAQLGPELAGRMEAPFFEVARGVGVAGAFQRVDAAVVSLWLFSDLAFLGLTLFALQAMLRGLVGAHWAGWARPVAIGLAFFGALFLFPGGTGGEKWALETLRWGNLILGFGLPPLLLPILRLRAEAGGHISSGEMGQAPADIVIERPCENKIKKNAEKG